MNRISMRSSNIVSVGYDSESETLEIEFSNGVYQYSPLTPHEIFDRIYPKIDPFYEHGEEEFERGLD